MKNTHLIIVILFSLSVLVGCIADEKYSLLSQFEDTVEIIVIFDENQQFDESIKNELFDHIVKEQTKEKMPVTMMRGTDKIIKKYNITEFPTIIITDNEQVLLQTTDINDVKEFISKRANINFED